MITPGLVASTVRFIGYLVAGLAGAVVAAIGIVLSIYLFTIISAPFTRNRVPGEIDPVGGGDRVALCKAGPRNTWLPIAVVRRCS